MITIDKINLFERYVDAGSYAYGSPTKASVVVNDDKYSYWEIYQDIIDSFNAALNKKNLSDKFYVKPKTFSKESGVRGHRPLDLWCAIRNINSKIFNEMPQLYAIVSNRGIELGFAISIPEKQYSDQNVKLQNREIIPLIHKKLPTVGSVVNNLDRIIGANPSWHVNLSTRLGKADHGFNEFTLPSELFINLKMQDVCYGGGSICKIISPDEINLNPVNMQNEVEDLLDIFNQILLACAPTEQNRSLINQQNEISVYTNNTFDPISVSDARDYTFRSIARRRGQKKFRTDLLDAYGSECVITNSKVIEVLQAAHIYPYRGEETNKIDNGLILRSDIHDLFDMFLISIEPESLCVKVSSILNNSIYESYNNNRIKEPIKKIKAPSRDALIWHFDEFKKING